MHPAYISSSELNTASSSSSWIARSRGTLPYLPRLRCERRGPSLDGPRLAQGHRHVHSPAIAIPPQRATARKVIAPSMTPSRAAKASESPVAAVVWTPGWRAYVGTA